MGMFDTIYNVSVRCGPRILWRYEGLLLSMMIIYQYIQRLCKVIDE